MTRVARDHDWTKNAEKRDATNGKVHTRNKALPMMWLTVRIEEAATRCGSE